MPIYAYRCSACGHAKDVLQKLSDPVLTVCPACGQATFAKQVTAAGFQLKGSGWYVTDFRDGQKGGKPAEKPAEKATETAADKAGAKTAEAPASAPASAPAEAAKPAAAPAPAPAASPTA
jgi:putative FmdB family regulatory protein